MNRDKDAAIFHSALIALSFIFRNAHADQSADESARRRANPETGERAHDGACGDERPETGDRKRSYSSK